MGRRHSTGVSVILLVAACQTAAATTFTAEITDQDGRPVANAVVSLVPDPKTGMPGASTRLPSEKVIDQRLETFVPIVTVVPRNGRVVFANSDPTTHQVYSFSPAKQFEITLARDTSSPPIVFSNPGVAALGCNIHDNMIAYVFVADSPWTALTGADGRAVIDDVPPGNYQAQVWHYRYPLRRELPNARIAVSTDTTRWAANIRVLTQTSTRSHAGSY
jgi:plastocyanin